MAAITSPDYSEMLLAIIEKYQPAGSFAEATDLFTTQELCLMFYNHTGIPIEFNEMYTTLKSKGFQEEMVSEMKMVWLMVNKP